MPTISVRLSYDEATVILGRLRYGGRMNDTLTTALHARIEAMLRKRSDYADWQTRSSADATAEWSRRR